MNIKQIVGDNIRFIREKRGWTQEDLAIVSKMSKTFIGDIERGEKSPTIITVEKMAKALKVEPNILLIKDAFKSID